MTGKAISRSLRGHFLVASAPTTKLITKYIPPTFADALHAERDFEDVPIGGEDDDIDDRTIDECECHALEPKLRMTEVEMENIKDLLSTVTDEPESAVTAIAFIRRD